MRNELSELCGRLWQAIETSNWYGFTVGAEENN